MCSSDLYMLRHDDGTVVTMADRGVRRGPTEVMARLAAGEVVEPSLYYFRTTPTFENGSEKYDWLNRVVTVGVGTSTGVSYRVYAIL